MKKKGLVISFLLLMLLCFYFHACAEEAKNITNECNFKTCATKFKYTQMTDGKYTNYWESHKIREPWIEIFAPAGEKIHGLYLCFKYIPEKYEIQVMKSGGSWKKLYDGDALIYHKYYPLEGVAAVRVQACGDEKTVLGFNEIFVFSQGDVPDWVQRWEPFQGKADILILVAHPDDELIFMGGAIPTYAVELGKNVLVAYLTWSNTSRRSELLNGLWTMGVRKYPVMGEFKDAYASPGTVEEAYKKIAGKKAEGQKKIWSWLTSLYRKYQPDVVVTHDLNGEYGHPQHKMIADAACKCYEMSADPDYEPDTVERYGIWQVKKLYIHLYGDESNQVVFDWNEPLETMNGKTGQELASEAYALHKTQAGSSIKVKGKKQILSVEETGKTFSNNIFGLYATEVGPDTLHDDFLENIF